MRKTLALAFIATLSVSAQADMIYGIYAEVGMGQSELDGSGSWNSEANSFVLEKDDTANVFGKIKLEHPVPLVPNVRLSFDQYDFQNNGSGTGFVYDDVNYGTEFGTEFDAVETTGTLYYEILDNVVSVDVGLSVKNIKTDLAFIGEDGNSRGESIDIWLPMGYLSAEVGVPFAGIVLGGEIETIAYDGNEVTMFDAYVGYELVDVIAADATFKIGFKSRDVVIDDLEGFNLDLTNQSVYGSVQIHF